MDDGRAIRPAHGQGLFQYDHHLPLVLVRPAAERHRAGAPADPRVLAARQAALRRPPLRRRARDQVVAAGGSGDPSRHTRR
eukprot:4755410-Pleurochrysis_carterae.AAC.6